MDLNKLLGVPVESEEDLVEDLLILQPDGTRVCVGWELENNGFSIDSFKKVKKLSDDELLKFVQKIMKNI